MYSMRVEALEDDFPVTGRRVFQKGLTRTGFIPPEHLHDKSITHPR